MSFLATSLSGCPPEGSFKLMLCSSSGVVMTKMINSTNARSSSGVMLISLNVTRALRWENRRMILRLGTKLARRGRQKRVHDDVRHFRPRHPQYRDGNDQQ